VNAQPVSRQTASGDDDAHEDAQIDDLKMQLNKVLRWHQQPQIRAHRVRQELQMRVHSNWHGMGMGFLDSPPSSNFLGDSRQDQATILRQQARTHPAPEVRDLPTAEGSKLASRVPPPVSEAFTVGIDKDGHLDKKAVRAFLQSNGDPQEAQRALSNERAHVGDEEVIGGDDNVDLDRAHAHLKAGGIRDLLKGLSGGGGW
jgi:hypothetical protein